MTASCFETITKISTKWYECSFTGKEQTIATESPLDTEDLQEWNTSIIAYMNTIHFQQIEESVLEKTNRSWADPVEQQEQHHQSPGRP